MCAELEDIAASMGWSTFAVPVDDDPEVKLQGVVLNDVEDVEALPFLFDEQGALRSLARLLSPDDNRKYTYYISCKTQYGTPQTHAWVCGLLRYLQRRYMPDLIVEDEGEYWTTGDMDLLARNMDFLDKKIASVADTLTALPVEVGDATPDELANLIGRHLEKNFSSTADPANPDTRRLHKPGDVNSTFGSVTQLDDVAGYEESFLKYVEAYENAPMTSYAKELIKNDIQLPPPNRLTASQLHEKLWEIIRFLGKMRVFLYSTNHLSDRELYTELWRDLLNHEIPCLFYNPESAWHLDILGSGSDEDTALWLRYYASEQERENWANEFPDDPLPEREVPPYHRDHLLPQCDH